MQQKSKVPYKSHGRILVKKGGSLSANCPKCGKPGESTGIIPRLFGKYYCSDCHIKWGTIPGANRGSITSTRKRLKQMEELKQ